MAHRAFGRVQALAQCQRLYAAKCAVCHGENGVSSEPEFPSLVGHRTVTMASSANLVRVIIGGGFPPTTPGNPAPFGMPPFGQELSDAEIAALASYVRGAWGHMASRVLPLEVQKIR